MTGCRGFETSNAIRPNAEVGYSPVLNEAQTVSPATASPPYKGFSTFSHASGSIVATRAIVGSGVTYLAVGPRDSITPEGKTTKFDGEKNALKQAKITPDDFSKAFTTADETYFKLLLLLSAELKK